MSPTFVLVLRTYLQIIIALIASFVAFRVGFTLSANGKGSQKRLWLRWAEITLFLSIFLPVVIAGIPKKHLWHPMVQVFSGVTKNSHQKYSLLSPTLGNSKGESELSGFVFQDRLVLWIGAIGFAAIFLLLLKSVWQFHSLYKEITSLPLIRKIGRLRIVCTENHPIPYSAWIPGVGAFVVVPFSYLPEWTNLKIAVRHELQHHRQGDTRLAYFLELLSALFPMNLAMNAWIRFITELQEMSCDETLVLAKRVSPQAYGRCLVQAAQHAVSTRGRLAGTTSLAARANGNLLKRRVVMILNPKLMPSRRWLSTVVGTGTLVLLATAAMASRSAIQDRSFTLAEASHLSHDGAGFPLDINEKVVEQLNDFVGTPEGRRFMKSSLRRLEIYRPMVEAALKTHEVPEEVIVVPLIESGYKDSRPVYQPGAGLWGFIAQTARRYHLMVNGKRDDRLDEEKETEAGMEYLSDLYNYFHDWRLALKAYNEGEAHVKTLIKEYGSNDPWYLETMAESKEHYLAKVTAAALILRNPSVMQ